MQRTGLDATRRHHPTHRHAHPQPARRLSRLLLGGLVSLVALHSAAQTPAAAVPAGTPLLPVESFYRHADMGNVQLSPGGKRLGVVVAVGQRKGMAVFTLDNSAPPKVVALFDDADIRWFRWVNDERLVFSLIDMNAGGGDQPGAQGLFSAGLDGTVPRKLIRTNWDELSEHSTARRDVLPWYHVLLGVPDGGGDEVVIGRMEFDRNRDLAEVLPLRLNVVTQQVRSLATGMPTGATGWLVDPKGEPRLALVTRGGMTVWHWRAPGSDTWKVVATHSSTLAPFQPHSVNAAGQLYVTVSVGAAATGELRLFDFATGQPAPDALVATPGFNFEGELVRDRSPGADGRVLGVRYETDAQGTHWFDPQMKALQQAADARLPGRVNSLSCARCLDKDAVVLVHSWSDQDPGRYWIHRPAGNQWELIGPERKDIEPRRMATLDLHRIKARDGMELPVWVTLPNAQAPGSAPPAAGQPPQRRPAVVLVHGGPWVRGVHWQWDVDAQFLASRGYVVIEPEFRGSTGYGSRLFHAGWKQWGLAMQDDLADALDWAVKKGWVDKDRVCIAGASYGGYAALMGPIRHPELYRCAVSWAAVSDLMLRYEQSSRSDLSEEGRRFTLPTLMGDPKTDEALLTANSPVNLAAKLKVPVLLAHGEQDRRVQPEHARRMRDALVKAGNPPEWVVYNDEGHGWLRPANRYDFARKMEAFLAKQLK